MAQSNLGLFRYSHSVMYNLQEHLHCVYFVCFSSHRLRDLPSFNRQAHLHLVVSSHFGNPQRFKRRPNRSQPITQYSDMGGTVLEASASARKSAKKSSKKKRKDPEANTTFEEKITYDKDATDEVDLDENEPTIAEKLATLDFSNNETTEIEEKPEPHRVQPPSADSVHGLLKQAINADDRALLLDCLYNQDQKVISNSVSGLISSDTFKLLNSLLSLVQSSRGAVLACSLPWLRSLLLHHASEIMSQESSLAALNSLYQLIDSRVSTFSAAVQLGSTLDSLYAGATGDVTDEDEQAAPVVYNDDDDSEDNGESEDDAMETDEENNEQVDEVEEGSSNVSDAEGVGEMSD